MLQLLDRSSAPRGSGRSSAFGRMSLLVLALLALCTLPASSARPVTVATGEPTRPPAAAGPPAEPTSSSAPTMREPFAPAPAVAPVVGRRGPVRSGRRAAGTPSTGSPRRDPTATQVRIERCQSTSPRVWLTFDDGGSPAQVHRILRVLRRARVQAIFFPIGSWAQANPGLVRQIARAGHLIGDHTHDHVDLAKVDVAEARWQIDHGIARAPTVPLLRPPFGAGAYTRRLQQIAAESGMRLCTWTVDTRDWTGASAATIVRRVRHGDRMTPPVRAGGVVIMHMNGDHTGRALPGVIRAVRARGLRLHQLPR